MSTHPEVKDDLTLKGHEMSCAISSALDNYLLYRPTCGKSPNTKIKRVFYDGAASLSTLIPYMRYNLGNLASFMSADFDIKAVNGNGSGIRVDGDYLFASLMFVTGAGSHGIHINEGRNALLSSTLATGCAGNGILVEERSKLVTRQSGVIGSGNTSYGIQVSTGSKSSHVGTLPTITGTSGDVKVGALTSDTTWAEVSTGLTTTTSDYLGGAVIGKVQYCDITYS